MFGVCVSMRVSVLLIFILNVACSFLCVMCRGR